MQFEALLPIITHIRLEEKLNKNIPKWKLIITSIEFTMTLKKIQTHVKRLFPTFLPGE